MATSVSTAGRVLLLGILFLAGSLATRPVHAQQPEEIPAHSDAELMFEQGLAAFERGEYERAAERFRLVNDYELNRKTTASLVMEGKALLRLARFQEAVDVLTTLLDRYPETSYREEAERVLDMAEEQVEQQGRRVDTLHIGVALPTASEYVGLTQVLFNGIRLAVDKHNGLHRRYVPPPDLQAPHDSFGVASTEEVYGDSLADAEGRTTVTTETDTLRVDSLQVVTEQRGQPSWIAKMHFRGIDGGAEAARSAVDSLVREVGADIVIGPLFSETARAAGDVAERARVPLMAPVATEESVSEGKEYVFQANPTIRLRGHIMARFASESLLSDHVAVIYERGSSYSERMADGFREEAENRDLEVPFTLRLDNPREWSRLPDAIEGDTTITDSIVAATDAFYLPIAGTNASGKIQDALTGLERVNSAARVLGNSEWHNLSIKKRASAFTATYANDFHVQTEQPEVQTFMRRYRMLTGHTPTPDHLPARGQRLAYTGYDLAQFVLETLSPSPSRPDPDDLRTPSTYQGLGVRIDFEEGNVNKAMFFHRYRNNRIELLR